MILTSVTMVGWADVPDSDWGDFRRWHDISSLLSFRSKYVKSTKSCNQMIILCHGILQSFVDQVTGCQVGWMTISRSKGKLQCF